MTLWNCLLSLPTNQLNEANPPLEFKNKQKKFLQGLNLKGKASLIPTNYNDTYKDCSAD